MNSTLADVESPIYQQLVHEHGDVVAAARATADETQRTAGELLDWSRRDSGQSGRPRA
ncbi:hypothetical protein [Streptomyces meridianus]|uniref:DUF305 domain-containing protein n=1 Tax=Streptomyces meridianus TaxID=2938945 RepID=A0ABT0X3T8_9ACTN|nr:hypothetical protein [Streptomyces meridianus]MCM2577207.1 hypothetical protein [Streptomyces meridianus]